MSLSLDLGVGLGSPPSSVVAPAINPNLLAKTEQFNDAVWIKTGSSVIANAATDPLSGSTADEITFSLGTGTIAQVSATAATSGSVISGAKTPNATWARFSTTATIDGAPYTFSLWMRDPGANGYIVRLKIDVSGGFIRCLIADTGDLADFFAWGAKLEAGTSATGAASTYGMVA